MRVGRFQINGGGTLVAIALVIVAVYVSAGVAAFVGASFLVILGLTELIGVGGHRFFSGR